MNVLIAGASSGIGMRCASLFIKRGCNVYNISRGECKVDKVVNIKADCSKPDEIRAAVKKAAENCAKFDIVIYCPGFSMSSPMPKTTPEDYRYLFEVNYFGAVVFIQSVCPFLNEQKSRIVIISSAVGLLPVPFLSFYSSSKAALISLVQSLNLEFPENIKAIAVLPGGTKTPFTKERKIYNVTENKEYFDNAVFKLAEQEQNGDGANAVANEIVKNALKKSPKILLVTGFKNKFRAALSNFIPLKLRLKMIKRKFNKK